MHVCVRVYVSGQVSTSASLRTSQMAFFFGRQTIILIATLAGRNNNKNKTKKKNKKKRSWIQSSIMRARQILLGSL